MSENLRKPQIEVTITIDAGRFRVRRLDERNLVIERQRADNGLWIITGYYGNPGSLAAALIDLAGTLPPDCIKPCRQSDPKATPKRPQSDPEHVSNMYRTWDSSAAAGGRVGALEMTQK